MNKLKTMLVSCGLCMSAGIVVADDHEGDDGDANVATPMEMFACKYNDGKGAADLNAATKKWNDWADKNGVDDYSAWTLVPYYFGPEQDFDVLWLGGSADAKTMGRVQDMYVAKGAKEAKGFADVATCDSHGAYSVLQMKAPPERDDSSKLVVTFSDCNMSEGVTFSDMYMPLSEWGEYMGEHGSTAGMWVFFASYGGGGEEFDFKWVRAYQNLEDLGADWDHVNKEGWSKVDDIFEDNFQCDSSRTYHATNVRRAEEDAE